MDDTQNKPRRHKAALLAFAKATGVAVILYLAFGYLISSPLSLWIQESFQRIRLYPLAEKRVAQAGGWKAVENACLAFSTNADLMETSLLFRPSTNELPTTLAALQPKEISLRRNGAGIPLLKVKIFGGHATGGPDTPYYGIWVICTNVSSDYVPPIEGLGHGMRGIIERKGPAIFEVR